MIQPRLIFTYSFIHSFFFKKALEWAAVEIAGDSLHFLASPLVYLFIIYISFSWGRGSTIFPTHL